MKKIIFIVCLVLLLGGCGPKANQPVSSNKAEKISGSIEDLLTKNKNIRCELAVKTGDTVMSGTTYVAGTRARSDYKNKMGDQTVTSHMINDGTWLYTWTEEYPDQAIKMNIKDMQALSGQEEAKDAGVENYQEKFDYDCYNWVKDESVFALPAGIKFTDYSEMMKSLENLMGGIKSGNEVPDMINTDKSSLCSACDSVPDASAKASCRSSLGCK